MNQKSEIILSVNDLSVLFGVAPTTSGVSSLSFQVQKGQTLAIVGESGSGKTVSSMSILGLLPKNGGSRMKGSVHLSGVAENLIGASSEVMRKIRGRKISMVFQEPMTSLNPLMSCGKQVSEVLQHHLGLNKKDARDQTIVLFRQVSLPRPEVMFDQYPHQLSGGQKQRVMIAMAIACKPDLLIADEPTTALDVTVQREIILLLKKIQEETEMSMIFITHDLALVAEVADEIMVMRHGKCVEMGKASEVLTNPKAPYTKGLLACRPSGASPGSRLLTVQDIEAGRMVASEKRTSSIQEELILEVRNLTKTYKGNRPFFGKAGEDVVAVSDVSFSVRRGETLGLVGESGCGKTTLSRILLRLIEPSEGSIVFDKKDLLSLSDAEMRKMRKEMQIIFQDPYSSLNPRITVGSAITEVMISAGIHAGKRKERTEYLLEKVGLKAEDYSKYPHQFSGGQRQRVVIARTLAAEPRFVICDESVSALDVSVQAQVLNLLNDLKEEFGLTYIFISHDLAVVRFMSDRIVVMNKGKLEEIGTPDVIFNNPASPYTKRLLESMPKLEVV